MTTQDEARAEMRRRIADYVALTFTDAIDRAVAAMFQPRYTMTRPGDPGPEVTFPPGSLKFEPDEPEAIRCGVAGCEATTWNLVGFTSVADSLRPYWRLTCTGPEAHEWRPAPGAGFARVYAQNPDEGGKG